jgi:hypothetical protein
MMDLTVILTGIGTALAIIGSNVALLTWLRSDMRGFESKIDSWKEQINLEMRDFHGRLEKQDAEYKASMQNIDYRFKIVEAYNEKRKFRG